MHRDATPIVGFRQSGLWRRQSEHIAARMFHARSGMAGEAHTAGSLRSMSLADIAFAVGPLGAVVVVPLAMVVLAVRRHPVWAVWLGALLALTVAVSWLAYWFLWGSAFDYANAFKQVPGRVDTALGVTMTVAALGCVGVALTTVTAVAHSRRAR